MDHQVKPHIKTRGNAVVKRTIQKSSKAVILEYEDKKKEKEFDENILPET